MKLSDEMIEHWRWTVGEVGDGVWVGGDLPFDEDDAQVGLLGWVDAGVTDILDVRGEWSDEEFVADYLPTIGRRRWSRTSRQASGHLVSSRSSTSA